MNLFKFKCENLDKVQENKSSFNTPQKCKHPLKTVGICLNTFFADPQSSQFLRMQTSQQGTFMTDFSKIISNIAFSHTQKYRLILNSKRTQDCEIGISYHTLGSSVQLIIKEAGKLFFYSCIRATKIHWLPFLIKLTCSAVKLWPSL